MLSAVRCDLAAGIGLLTRLPVGWLLPRNAPFRPGRAVWTYPLAGLLVGGAIAAVQVAARRIGLPPMVGAVWAIAAGILLTGGLHEDGLGDAADGMAGRTRERRLEIMRDSRIGSYGALALILALAIRIGAVAALPGPRSVADLLAAGALSRGAMLPVLALLAPARADGLGRSLGRPAGAALGTGMTLAMLTAMALLPIGQALVALGLALAVALLAAAAARRNLGGHTGDVLGATCVAAECVLLSVFAARAPMPGQAG